VREEKGFFFAVSRCRVSCSSVGKKKKSLRTRHSARFRFDGDDANVVRRKQLRETQNPDEGMITLGPELQQIAMILRRHYPRMAKKLLLRHCRKNAISRIQSTTPGFSAAWTFSGLAWEFGGVVSRPTQRSDVSVFSVGTPSGDRFRHDLLKCLAKGRDCRWTYLNVPDPTAIFHERHGHQGRRGQQKLFPAGCGFRELSSGFGCDFCGKHHLAQQDSVRLRAY